MNKANSLYAAFANLEADLDKSIQEECLRLLGGKTEAFFYLEGRTFSEDHAIKVECLSVTESGVYVSLKEEFDEALDIDSAPTHVNLLDLGEQINVYEILVALQPDECDKEDPEHDELIYAAFALIKSRENMKLHLEAVHNPEY